MTDNRTFTAAVDAFVGKTKDQMKRVVQQSAQDITRIAQTPVSQGGNMPVDTGALRNSLVSGLNGADVGKGEDSYTLAIAGYELGDVISVAWTADYATARHYAVGVGQGGGLWRDRAAQQWGRVVQENARKVQ
jgi:hypothetical protein